MEYVNKLAEHAQAHDSTIKNETLEHYVETVVVRILKTVGTFDGSDSFDSFVMGIAEHVARDEFGLGGNAVGRYLRMRETC